MDKISILLSLLFNFVVIYGSRDQKSVSLTKVHEAMVYLCKIVGWPRSNHECHQLILFFNEEECQIAMTSWKKTTKRDYRVMAMKKKITKTHHMVMAKRMRLKLDALTRSDEEGINKRKNTLWCW